MSKIQSRQLYFHRHIIPKFWEQYTIEMAPLILQQVVSFGRHHLPTKSNRNILIIETRAVDSLAFTIYNSLLLTDAEVGLELCVSDNILSIVQDIIKPLTGVRLIRIQPFSSVTEYNRLLTSRPFWQALRATQVLLVQTDSMLLHTYPWHQFQRWNYIGSPWKDTGSVQLGWPNQLTVSRTLNPIQNLGTNRVGNGGFSFRHVAEMLRVIDRHPYPEYGRVGQVVLPEDVYFSRYATQVADYDTAVLFGTESVYNPKAYVMHKLWEYQSLAHVGEVLQRHYLHVCEKQPKQTETNNNTCPTQANQLPSGSVLQFGTS